MSYSAPYIDPHFFWPIAFIGIAYPILLLVNLLFVVFWLFRKPRFAFIAFVPIVLGWGAFTKNMGFAKETLMEKPDDTSTFRLMSYNVHMFRSFDETKKVDNKRKILEIFTEVSPDIICIQEFYTRKKGKDDIRQALIKELGYSHHYFQPVAHNDYDAYGIAIFSKYPIKKTGTLPINVNKKIVNRVLYADIQKNGKMLRVYNVHLQSIGFKERDYEFIKNISTNMDEELASTKRIGGRLKNAFIKRSEQVNLLYEHIRKCEIPYVVAGDFNDTPLSFSVNKIAGEMQNTFVRKGRGWGVTYNGDFPNFQIDYIMASKDFEVTGYKIIHKKLSDHFPIWSDLKL